MGVAYAIEGKGSPPVKAGNWMTHLDYDRQSPIWRHWVRELSRGHALIRYDERGCGLSDRQFDGTPTLDTYVGDLAAVVDAAGLERFALFGVSGGGPTAIEYAVIIPSAGEEQQRWYDDIQQASSSGELAARLSLSNTQTDISDTARRITQPALVLHARHDRAVPYEEGRRLASLLPDVRFVTLETDNHILQQGEPAWEAFLAEVRAFLATTSAHPPWAPISPS